jgi:hypothetical protein
MGPHIWISQIGNYKHHTPYEKELFRGRILYLCFISRPYITTEAEKCVRQNQIFILSYISSPIVAETEKMECGYKTEEF